MQTNGPSLHANALTEEHGLLGATLEPDQQGLLVPSYYGDATGEPQAWENGCALADVSGLVGLTLDGVDAPALASMAFASATPLPGQVTASVALRGDGTVVSPVLLAGTGKAEFACWAPAETASELHDWLQGLLAIEQAGARPFREVSLGPATVGTVTLALAGAKADAVLGDYLAPGTSLPAAGTIRNLRLDAIDVIAARIVLSDDLWTVLWVPESRARVLWRSLLSFDTVTPVGSSALWARVAAGAPGLFQLLDDPELALRPAQCGLEGLVRDGVDFIGARALRQGQEGEA